MNTYQPKSAGKTVLKHQVSRLRARVTQNDGLDAEKMLVSIPYVSAVELVEDINSRGRRHKRMLDQVESIMFQMELEQTPLRQKKLRLLANNLYQQLLILAQK
jgi:hypothetical protein